MNQEYTEKTVYPKINDFLTNRAKLLDDYFDCNSFKLQLQEIWNTHQKAGTLDKAKEAEITAYAKKVHKLQNKLERSMT